MTTLRRSPPPCVHVALAWAALLSLACSGLDDSAEAFVAERARTLREFRCGFELAVNFASPAPGVDGCIQYSAPPPFIVAPDGTHECEAELWSGSIVLPASEPADVFVPAPATKDSAKNVISWQFVPCP